MYLTLTNLLWKKLYFIYYSFRFLYSRYTKTIYFIIMEYFTYLLLFVNIFVLSHFEDILF